MSRKEYITPGIIVKVITKQTILAGTGNTTEPEDPKEDPGNTYSKISTSFSISDDQDE